MNKKEALDLIDTMISEAQGDGTDSLKQLRDKLVTLNVGYSQPLYKAINEVQEILKKASATNMTYMSEKEPVKKKYEGFKSVEERAKESGARDPAAVAAAAGRKKYGKKAFQEAATAGHKMGHKKSEGMQKVDPKTHLPGVMLDKIATPGMGTSTMDTGSSNMSISGKANLNPRSDMAKTVQHGGAPGNAPSLVSSEKALKDFMQKCMKCMKTRKSAANPDEKQDAKLGEGVEHLVEDHMIENSAAERKEGHKFQPTKKSLAAMSEKPMGKPMKKDLGGTGAPSTPTSSPDAGYGKVIAKGAPKMGIPAPKLNPTSSIKAPAPNPKDPAMNPGMHAPKPPTSNYVNKATAFIKNWKNRPIQKKEDFPKASSGSKGDPNKVKAENFDHKAPMAMPDDQALKDASSQAKRAINEPKAQPIKVGAQRPGQANAQSPMGKLNKKEPLGKPYASDAQRKWAHTEAGTKALGGKGAVHEWDEASRGKKLPEHVKKANESKHDRCVEHVKENSPEVKNPHAVCVAEGVKPSKWKK